MRQLLSKKLGALALALGLIASAPAFAIGLDPAVDAEASRVLDFPAGARVTPNAAAGA